MSVNVAIIVRRIRRAPKQAALFVLCVALSMVTLTALGGFSDSVGRALVRDARQLHAADIIIRTPNEMSDTLNKALDAGVRNGRLAYTTYYRFYSVARTLSDDASLLADLKVVDKAYPFYGRVVLRSGRPLHNVLARGRAVAEQALLDRLGLRMGDRVKVGHTELRIDDVVVSEPDRPVNLFSLGPRLFVSMADLSALNLVRTGSRIRRVHLVKLETPDDLPAVLKDLRQAALPEQERVDSYRTARSGVKRFLDNFLYYLNLTGVFILVVSGIGIQSALTALFNEKRRTIAIMKALGATNGYITRYFFIFVMVLGTIGALLGIAGGYAAQYLLFWMLKAFLPQQAALVFSWRAVAQGLVTGYIVVAIFAIIPLSTLRRMRPLMIFRQTQTAAGGKRPFLVFGMLLALFVVGLVFWHMEEIKTSLYVTGGIGGLVLAAALLTNGLLWFIRRMHPQNLILRQAVRGLFRRGNAVRAIVVTLTVSLCVLFSIYLVEKNLAATFVDAFPDNTPNLYFIDIQPDQKQGFERLVEQPVRFYPVVRARVAAINGTPIDRQRERKKRRDNFGRTFNLTYRDTLLDNEALLEGRSLFREDWKDIQVSILDTVTEMRPIAVGDRIRFNIQGVGLQARVASIRTRTRDTLRPFFYFVFQPDILKEAPQTLFAALQVEKHQVGPLQSKVVAAFPNISVIDLSQTLRALSGILRPLSATIRVFSLLSVAAGLLILISAVSATRNERIVESVYYKILGARKRFLFGVIAVENMIIGFAGSLVGVVMAQAAAYVICRYALHIAYTPFIVSCAWMTTAAVMLVAAIGLAASRSIAAQKPVIQLRRQSDG